MVHLSKSLKIIGRLDFRNCSSLKSIVIPDGVTYIGNFAFGGCTSLADITIPSTVTHIDISAFSGTAWLYSKREQNPVVVVNNILIDVYNPNKTVVVPNNVRTIAGGAFIECSDLTVVLPESVTRIDHIAFYKCSNITINIPQSVTDIDDSMFFQCSEITIKGYAGSLIEKYANQNRTY